MRDRHLILIEVIEDVLRLKRRSWAEAAKDFRPDHVRQIYRAVGYLWPRETSCESLYPAPGDKLRALYVGDARPESVTRNLLRYSLYADEVYAFDPFELPWRRRDDYNPIKNPADFLITTLRKAYYLVQLKPWIEAGIITLLPSPSDFDQKLRKHTWALAQRRRPWVESQETDMEIVGPMMVDAIRLQMTLTGASLEAVIADQLSDAPPQARDWVKREYAAGHSMPLMPTIATTTSQVLNASAGETMEVALMVAGAIGAVPYTSSPVRWNEMRLFGGGHLEAKTSPLDDPWGPLTQAFQSVPLNYLDRVDAAFALQMRRDDRLAGFRQLLRRTWSEVNSDAKDADAIRRVALSLADELGQVQQEAEHEWSAIGRELINWTGASIAGAIAGGALSWHVPAAAGVSAATALLGAYWKRRDFSRKPSAILFELSSRQPR